MSRTRVLVVNHTARLGGGERVLLTFLSQLSMTSLEAKLVAPAGPLLEEARRLGIECFPLMSEELRSTRKALAPTDLLKTVQLYRTLTKVTKAYAPDILLSNSVKAHVLANFVSRRLGIPLAIRLHDQLSTFSTVAQKLMMGPLRRARLVSCVSESVADDVRNIVGAQCKVKVCYNGVPFDTEPCEAHVPKPRIVAAGWMLPWKGFDIFIRAMEIVAECTDEWEFVIAGDVASDVAESLSYKEQLRQAVERSKWRHRFIFAGPYEKLRDVVCCPKHTIFVLPSQRPDPLPTVVLEAGALGLPVVATNLGGSREMISSGRTGILTDMDPRAISEAVQSLVMTPERRMRCGEALRAHVKARFSVKSYVDQLNVDILSCVAGLDGT
ncbi:glycosyltransferase family 4 protein [Alicyclobacillus pomorum]|uniref:glycosyltransferase family 4 protein n=1 Tax=Alicyclobacillus pomorum TaxID=204470 RepID=UPI00041A806C|nr:glycosyltransferase family 4 protein [Alicyclobacillus pomorum]